MKAQYRVSARNGRRRIRRLFSRRRHAHAYARKLMKSYHLESCPTIKVIRDEKDH